MGYGITVLTMSHDRPHFIKQAVNSVLWQTFTDFEYIIIDNSEKEGTRPILKEYKDERIKLFYENPDIEKRHKECIVSFLLNKYMEIAQGKYIFFFGDDDILFPNCFEEMYNFSEANNGECSHCCQLWLTYHDGGMWLLNGSKVHGFPNIVFNDKVSPSCKATGGAILIRKDFLKDVEKPWFPLDSAHCATSDAVFFEKVAMKHPIYPINKVLSIWRSHKDFRSFEWWRHEQ
jgi:glycosyltransferase involved in cell wall biosynthesis